MLFRSIILKKVSNYTKPNRKKMKMKDTDNGGGATGTELRQKRVCLKCGEKFPSKGPYNRVCDKCSSVNERVASSTYAVRKSPPSESKTLEKRFYGLN
mgnify:FL=1